MAVIADVQSPHVKVGVPDKMTKNNATKRSGGNASAKNSRQGQRSQASAPARVLRANKAPTPRKGGVMSRHELLLDANCLGSLSLPRAVAPYTTVRSTCYISSASKMHLFGTFANAANPSYPVGEDMWSNAVAVAPIDSTLPVSTAVNTTFSYAPGLGGVGSTAGRITMTPACVTVNITNGNPLQTTTGMIYAGRMDQPADWRGSGSSWDALMSGILAYKAPKAVSASQLALDGLTVSALPAEMSTLSLFRSQYTASANPVTWDASSAQHPAGFGLIYVHNPNGVSLNFQVTVEWRLRFDSSDPASSSHTFHPPSSEATWSAAIKSMVDSGHGVFSLLERSAQLLAWNRQYGASTTMLR